MAKKSPSLGLAGKGPGYSGAPISSADQARFNAEDDLRTLHRAAEIRGDRGRMAGAGKHAKMLMKAVKR